MTRRT